MIAHILTAHITKRDAATHAGCADVGFPYHLAGRAAVLLREQYPAGSTTRNWIQAGRTKLLLPELYLLEMLCPNNVSAAAVITAVNRAIRYEQPSLQSFDWTTTHFATIHCMNQDQ